MIFDLFFIHKNINSTNYCKYSKTVIVLLSNFTTNLVEKYENIVNNNTKYNPAKISTYPCL